MKCKRIIYLGTEVVKEAIVSKEAIEALAAVLSIKLTFVNSVIKNATATRVMKILRIGFTRYNRAINYAIARGWLVRDGNKLIATLKLKELNKFNIRLCFSRCFYVGKRNAGDDIVSAYSLTELCNIIRQGVLLFHISKQATVYDTITMATHPTHRQGRDAMLKAKRRSKRWGMCEPKLKGKADKLSYARMAQVAGCSKSKSKSLIKTLVKGGVIDKHENFKRTNISVEDYRANGALLRELHFEARKRGCLVYHEGKVCVRLANSYTLNRQPIKFKYANAQ